MAMYSPPFTLKAFIAHVKINGAQRIGLGRNNSVHKRSGHKGHERKEGAPSVHLLPGARSNKKGANLVG